MDYLRQVAGSREGAKEVKLFGLNKFFTERFEALAQQIYIEDVTLSRSKLIIGGLLGIIGTLGYYGAYVYVIWRTLHGAYDIGQFTFLTAAIQQASSNLQQVFSTASGIADQALFLTDLLAFFEMQPTVQSKPNALPAPNPIQQGFEFRNVSFTYPGTERTVLHNFNFTLSPGERIALIGENGQGKTTVVKLITRLYDPSEGQILLDGIDLREYSIEDLHRQIGVIFQDFMRFEMTARENIAVGRIDHPHQQTDIEDAAHKSLADTVVDKLHPRLRPDTGPALRKWSRTLRRRVAKDGPRPRLPPRLRNSSSSTSRPPRSMPAANSRSSSALPNLLRERWPSSSRTAFSTVRMADRIVVLSGGRLIEEGNHQQLMAKNGLYASMFEMQAASYR